MKLTVFLILISLVSVFANKIYSQSKMLSLNMEKATIHEVLSKIEDQSEFHFMYSGKVIDVNRLVSINMQDAKIDAVLKSLFAGTDISYTLKDRLIVLSIPEATEGLATQQQKTVSGKVTDSSGSPLPGVSVLIKSTNLGIITDVDGNYTLSNVPLDGVLVFSFVGMRSQEISVNGRRVIDIRMEEETIGLEEVVAVGYGTQKKANLTGSVVSVGNVELTKRPTPNVQNLLQGKISGLQIT